VPERAHIEREVHKVETKELIKRAGKFAKPFRVTDGESFHLKDIDPDDTLDLDSDDKPRAKEALPWASRPWPSCRTCSTRRTAGRCC
jgi:hypothetical protein